MPITVKPIKIDGPNKFIAGCLGCQKNPSTLIVEIGSGSNHRYIMMCNSCRHELIRKLKDVCVNCKYWKSWNVFRSHGFCKVEPKHQRFKAREAHCNKFERIEEDQVVIL